MHAEVGRSPEMRRLAERALVLLLWELRGTDIAPIVLGGLVPALLSAGLDPPAPVHLGTTDVDLLISFELDLETAALQLGELEAALRRAGFEPDGRTRGGWRWRTELDGALIKVEFLCDRDDVRSEEVIGGDSGIGVLNLRGTGYVAEDFEPRRVRATLRDGQQVEVDAQFAGLEGYLLAKMCALRERGLEKDYYDFVYVLLFNTAGGPAQSARALRSGRFAAALPGLASLLREVEARFSGPESYGAASYARQAKIADPEGDVQVLAQDAVAAVKEFFDAVRRG